MTVNLDLDLENIDVNELPMDEETKSALFRLRKLHLETSELELLQKKAIHDNQSNKDVSEKNRLELENALRIEKQKQILAQLTNEHEKATLLNSLLEDKNKQQELETSAELLKFNHSILELKLQKEKLELQIALRDKLDVWKSQVTTETEYLREPFIDGYLVVSDRRIDLNGIIYKGTARQIIEQIEFFNNQSSEYPIFLVIDSCCGGSVQEGLQIVKAMRYSRSPVYVVVKGFSASMSAVITTLATKSFALPDAVILHHQLFNFSFGNAVEQREQLKILEEWTNRTLQPVAEKMGLTLREFTDQMYVNNSTGDWREFADKAVKLKWVDHVVTDIRETGYIKKPLYNKTIGNSGHYDNESIDAQGKPHVQLPRLSPMDMYYIYNSDKYYQY